MPAKPFWEIVKDHEKKTFEIITEASYDDEALNETVCNMQAVGLPTLCETAFHSDYRSRASVVDGMAQIGFKEETGLWSRMHQEYQRRTAEKGGGI